MGIFSFLKRKKVLKCDWCGEEMEEPSYFRYVKGRKYIFCSASCKRNFKINKKGKGTYVRCPTCPMAPKSWD